MNRLDSAVAQLVTELHPDRIEVIARAVEKEKGSGFLQALKQNSGMSGRSLLWTDFKAALDESPEIDASNLAGRLRTAVAVAQILGAKSTTELVWSGPSTGFVPIRHTEQVLTGLIDEARERLFIVSFVAYKVKSVLAALKRAQARGVKIRVLIERSSEQGGCVDTDSIRTMREAVPDAEFLIWEESKNEGPYAPKVHAKCAVADEKSAFITSANLTNAAMETNMELGVLIRGGMIPRNLAQHLNALVVIGRVKPFVKGA